MNYFDRFYPLKIVKKNVQIYQECEDTYLISITAGSHFINLCIHTYVYITLIPNMAC